MHSLHDGSGLNVELVTAPQDEPISLQAAKDHLRVTLSDDDTYIGDLIKAATESCERFQDRAYITQTWRLWLDNFPGGDTIRLPRPPLQSVTAINWYSPADVATEVATTVYRPDVNRFKGIVVLKDGEQWPSDDLRSAGGVSIEFNAGYGNAASNVPFHIRQLILITLANWYENREPIITGMTMTEIPLSAKWLLWQDAVVPM